MGQDSLLPWAPPAELAHLFGHYLAGRRWYGGNAAPTSLSVVDSGCLAELGDATRLLWAIVDADGELYQLLIAERPTTDSAAHLQGQEFALIGVVGDRVYYGATIDSEMAIALLGVASGGLEDATRARRLNVDQSHTSIVYDDRLIMKVFRRLSPGPNPDVEVTEALARTGFSHVPLPLVRWQRDGHDLAFGQVYLAGGTDGWALALTSLRDFYATGAEVAEGTALSGPHMSGGDFAAEASRLGQVTAEMHLAMAEAFGAGRGPGKQRPPAEPLAEQWPGFVAALEEKVTRLGPELAGSARPLLNRLAAVEDPGPAVRAHGDYHLGQVMRSDTGWYVLDFEGEPNRPLEERLRPTSVLKDVAGMLRSLQYASRFALRERAESEPAVLEQLARAWEHHNAAAFLRGYYDTKFIDDLLPPGPEDREAVRVAFELDKALYELEYEQAYRPEWVPIPLAALQRLLSDPVEDLLAGFTEPSGEDGESDELEF